MPGHGVRHVELLEPGHLVGGELERLGGERVLDVSDLERDPALDERG